MLEIKNLAVKFGGKVILQNINFQMQKGQTLGLLGVNGAGKTSLFNTLFYNNLKNCYLKIDGVTVTPNEISYIESENNFFPFLSVKEFLQLVNFSNTDRSEVLCEIFKLPQDTYTQHLSTGEKKKLAIAAQLLSAKKLYLLDEPFNGLDFESYELLQALLKSDFFNDKYAIITSHILDSLTGICQHIVELKGGRIERIFETHEYGEIRTNYGQQVEKEIALIEKILKK